MTIPQGRPFSDPINWALLNIISDATLPSSGIYWVWYQLGKPSANGLDDQHIAELFFYRFQMTQNLAITPDVQLILNPEEDTI
jgi:hypothetical protein